MVVTYDIKLFITGSDRHIGILMSLLLLIAETITFRSNTPDVFLGKCVLKICNKYTGEHPCRSVISIKLQGNCKSHFGVGVFL